MDKERLRILLTRLTESTISPGEYAELVEYFRNEQDESVEGEVMRDMPEHLPSDRRLSRQQADKIYRKVLESPRYSGPTRRGRKSLLRRSGWQVAAAVLLAIGVLGGLFYYSPTELFRQEILAYQEKTVSPGKREKIRLADGTVVWINAASSIRYPVVFDGPSREVYVEGEAYFEVAHLSGKPFIVHTGLVSTRVLGTAFNVQAYQGDWPSVTVARGKVAVREGRDELGVLTAGGRLEFDQERRQWRTSRTDVGIFTAWKNGALVLHDVNLEEAAAMIGRWFGVEIHMADKIPVKARFTASFLPGEDLQKVLDVVSQLNALEYRIEGAAVTISQDVY